MKKNTNLVVLDKFFIYRGESIYLLTIKKLEMPYEADGVMHWKFKDWEERGNNGTYFSIQFDENNRMRCPCYPDFEAQMIFRYGSSRFLSEFLTIEDAKEWDFSRPVFISAPTGAGKSRFVLRELLRYAIDQREVSGFPAKILLLSNRIALNRQLKRAVAEFIQYEVCDRNQQELLVTMMNANPRDFDDCIFDFDVITVCSYHRMKKDAPDLRRYSIIVCDEFHFFTSDAGFNDFTGKIMERIIREGQHAIRVYMSATPEVAFEPVLREEFRIFTNCYGKNHILEIFFYHLARDFGYIGSIFNYEGHELIDAVRQFDGKWIIFVDSNERGKEIKNALEKDRHCVFISRSSLGQSDVTKVFNKLVESESFPNDVDIIICTAILDNGVNIHDASVRNVAIETFDRVEFLQMLGRIRQGDKCKLRLFIREAHPVRLAKWLDESMRDLAEKIMDEIDTAKKSYDIGQNGFVYTGMCREINRNRIFYRLDAIHRMQRVLCVMRGNSSKVSLPSPNPDYANIYNFFMNELDEDILDHALREDILHIFRPPAPEEGKLHYGVFRYLPTFLDTVHGILIPGTIGYDTIVAQYHCLFANNVLQRTALEEILSWIEKNLDDCMPLASVLHQTEAQNRVEFCARFIVNLSDIAAHKKTCSKPGKDDRLAKANDEAKAFLAAHGIKKGSKEHMMLKSICPDLERKELRSGMEIVIPEVGKFLVESLRAADPQRTASYFLVPLSKGITPSSIS